VDADGCGISADPKDLPYFTGGQLIPYREEECFAVSLGERAERSGDFGLARDHGGRGGGEELRNKSIKEGLTSEALPTHVGEDLAADANGPSDFGPLRDPFGLLPEEQHGLTYGIFGLIGRRSAQGVPPGRLIYAIDQLLKITCC